MDFEMDASEITGWGEAMAQKPKETRTALMQTATALAGTGQGWSIQGAPRDTGVLAGGITLIPAKWAGDTVSAGWASTADHGLVVETGHSGIRPVRAKVLRFLPKGGGAAVFTKYVKPWAGKPYMRPARLRLAPLVPQRFAAAIRKVLSS